MVWDNIYGMWKRGDTNNDQEELFNREENLKGLDQFLENITNNCLSIPQLMQVVSFSNYILGFIKGSIIDRLEKFINSLIGKLTQLAQKFNGVLFQLEIGTGFHVSMAFQVKPLKTN